MALGGSRSAASSFRSSTDRIDLMGEFMANCGCSCGGRMVTMPQIRVLTNSVSLLPEIELRCMKTFDVTPNVVDPMMNMWLFFSASCGSRLGTVEPIACVVIDATEKALYWHCLRVNNLDVDLDVDLLANALEKCPERYLAAS